MAAPQQDIVYLLIQDNYSGKRSQYQMTRAEWRKLMSENPPDENLTVRDELVGSAWHGLTPAEIQAALSTLGELANQYGTEIDRDDILSARQHDVMARLGQALIDQEDHDDDDSD
jgi:hypothetical protein